MLDKSFFEKSKAEHYYEDANFNIWKFPADVPAAKRQARPIILNYSIMTRAYATCFNKDSFIDYFNRYGFDVYLMDWGKDDLFSLSGWTLDKLADSLNDKAVDPLLKEYKVDSLNIFGICIGGLITSHMINRGLKKNKNFPKKFNKISYYGSPILGARDLGMAKTFVNFYHTMKPYRKVLHDSGVSLFFLDAALGQGISTAMLNWTWQQFWQEGPKTFDQMVLLTVDDRWVPFAAFMDILEEAFASAEKEESFHFNGDVSNIHFFNIVGDSDLLVMPSASIVEYGSPVPQQFASFEQMIFPGGHFIFAQPGFTDVKEKLAAWYAKG
ncbi:MAG: hypothetical protein ACM31L_11610 [Actinomycetota bacterium]